MRVTVRHLDKNTERAFITNDSGLYYIPPLVPTDEAFTTVQRGTLTLNAGITGIKVKSTLGSKGASNPWHGLGYDQFKSTALNAAPYGFDGVAYQTPHPSQPGLTWTPSDATGCQTMVFDYHCRMVDDPTAHCEDCAELSTNAIRQAAGREDQEGASVKVRFVATTARIETILLTER